VKTASADNQHVELGQFSVVSRVACAVPPPYVLSPGSNLKCRSRSRDHIFTS